MLINQDFAQSEPKSPAKRRLQLVGKVNQGSGIESATSDLDRATKLLQETVIKIEGAYAPSTIRVRISAIVTACFRFSVTGKALVFEGSVIVV